MNNNMRLFLVGDRVSCIMDHPWSNKYIVKGWAGTVVDNSNDSVGVRWDNEVGGHDLDGKCDNGHGWWVSSNQIAHIIDVEDDDTDDSVKYSDDDIMKLILG